MELGEIQVKPWEHQLVGAEWIFENERVYLTDKMGLGKTGTVYLALRKWIETGKVKRVLVLTAGKNAQLAWYQEAIAFGIQPPKLVRGTPEQRKKIWASGHAIVGATVAVAMRDTCPQDWDLIIGDEVHKFYGRKSKGMQLLKWFKSKYMVLCTGSPMRKGPQDMWVVLNALRLKLYSSYWRFVGQYCLTIDGPFGMEIIGAKNPEKMAKDLAHIWMMRDKTILNMPPKVRQFIPIEMSDVQKRWSKSILDDAILELSDDKLIIAPGALAKITRLRQIMCCPMILDPKCGDFGAGIESVIETLDEADDKHTVIFTPFKTAIPYFIQVLKYAGYNAVQALHGGIEMEDLKYRIEEFRELRGIIVCSIAYAESFTLNSATWCNFVGYDWDPENNSQAEDRLHRGAIKNSVLCRYMKHIGTVDEDVLQINNDKFHNTQPVYRQAHALRMSLLRMRESL